MCPSGSGEIQTCVQAGGIASAPMRCSASRWVISAPDGSRYPKPSRLRSRVIPGLAGSLRVNPGTAAASDDAPGAHAQTAYTAPARRHRASRDPATASTHLPQERLRSDVVLYRERSPNWDAHRLSAHSANVSYSGQTGQWPAGPQGPVRRLACAGQWPATVVIRTDAGAAHSFEPAFPCHQFLLGAGKYGLTQLRNVDRLPATGAVVLAAPLPIVNGSGSPCRVLALVAR